MGYNAFHSITLKPRNHPVTNLQSLAEEWKALYPNPPLLIDCEFEANHAFFTTRKWDYGQHFAHYISTKCQNTEVHLISSGDYYCRYHELYTFFNGKLKVSHLYEICDCQIQVPACLGHENNIYETLAYIPEMFDIDRNDNFAVAADVLKKAIRLSPDTTGRTLLEDETSAEYKEALDLAIHSLVKYYDFVEDTESELAITTEPSSTSSASDDEDFPF